MPVNLSIKAVPDTLAEKLRKRAAKNHRSLQGELITILEESLEGPRPLTVDESIRKLRQIEIRTASDSTEAIRGDRNSR
ncbi:MAG: Arc family DNA-binding protein [Deltaproteobacteria bacterium]|nr:Arc family DNA-binding protein [Deltaproteobacteria bacterium]